MGEGETPMRPASIVHFERLYWASILLGLVVTYLSWNATVAAVQLQPGVRLGEGFVAAVAVVGLAIQVLLWYFIARQPSIVVKWIFVVLFALGVLGTIFNVISGVALGEITTVLSILTYVLRGLATWMLFRPDTKIWFGEDVPGTEAP
jgi:hypothetical protein